MENLETEDKTPVTSAPASKAPAPKKAAVKKSSAKSGGGKAESKARKHTYVAIKSGTCNKTRVRAGTKVTTSDFNPDKPPSWLVPIEQYEPPAKSAQQEATADAKGAGLVKKAGNIQDVEIN